MKIGIITIFPEIFSSFLDASLIGKARARGIIDFTLIDIRKFADPPHYHVDDVPYGGGAGMVMRPEPLTRAIEHARTLLPDARVVLLSASGDLFTQRRAESYSKLPNLILVCGRYEGVDQRVIDLLIDEEISIGNYVMMGGEVAAMAVIEAAVRLVPEVVGNADSLVSESFNLVDGEMTLEAPQYTRPAEFRGQTVPDTLLSGNHARIAKWRAEQSKARTAARRPDLKVARSEGDN